MMLARDVPQFVVDIANTIDWQAIPIEQRQAGFDELTRLAEQYLTRKQPGQAYGGHGGQRVHRAVPQEVLDALSQYDWSRVPQGKIVEAIAKSRAMAALKERGIPTRKDIP